MSPHVDYFGLLSTQAEQLRIDGNNCFKKERFQAAIEAYTEAITLRPDFPVYWTNRALSHLKLNEWTKVEEDSRQAIKLDNNLVKAHYTLGLALVQRQEYAEGILELEKALNLDRGANPKGQMVEEIRQELVKAKYLKWESSYSKRSWELQNLKGACEYALKEKHFLDVSDMGGVTEDATASHLEQLEALETMFNKVAKDDMPGEVPDYLCCRITFDILCDPVTTPSGLTYERTVILEHLEKVGKFDPVTRDPLDPSQLIPNLAIKEAVEAFLDKNGWAYKDML